MITTKDEEEKADPGGLRQDECVHFSETACMSVCTLVRHHVSACEWGGYWRVWGTFIVLYIICVPAIPPWDPELLGQNMGPELLGRPRRPSLR